MYEKLIPHVNAEGFEALIDSDIATCVENLEAEKLKIELIG